MEERMTPRQSGGIARSRWLLLLVALLLLGGALLVGLLRGGVEESASETVVVTPTPAEATEASAHGDSSIDAAAIERISAEEAKARYDAGTAVFVDVRSGADYEAAHIADAVSITSSALEERLQNLPPDVTIIVYADEDAEEASVRGAQIFMEIGFSNVVALEGGMQSWQDFGYPTASGR